MAKKTDVKTTSKKKKSWFSIVAPSVFNEMSIGETTAVDANDLNGRSIKVSLMNLTRNMKKQNITMTFRIDGVKDKVAQTHVSAYETNPSSVKRFVRRRRDKIDDSVVAKTKDDKLVRVKPMLLTRNNTSNSVQTEIRHLMRYKVINDVSKLTYGQFVEKVINDQFAKDIKFLAQRIYPVRNVSIRAFILQEGTKEAKPTKLVAADAESYKLARAKQANAAKAREVAREKAAEVQAVKEAKATEDVSDSDADDDSSSDEK